MTRLLSLAHLTAIDLSPPDLIHAAAAAGFDAVGLRLIRVTEALPGYPLMTDHGMMRTTRRALLDTGIMVHDIEFVKIEPDTDVAALDPFLDAGAELGAREIITAPYDPDLSRLSDRLAALAERARLRGLGVSLEFFPWTCVPNLNAALSVATRGGSDIGVLVDSLHFDRSDSTIADLRNVPKERIRFAHLCDAPVCPPYSTEDLLFAGREERLAPGDGEIDLSAFVEALPTDLPLALEIPMTARSATIEPETLLAEVYGATRKLLDRISAEN